MNKKEIIEKTRGYIEEKSARDSSGHDWWHTQRVWKMARKIAKIEKADLFIVEMAALLHDAFDWKFYDEEAAKEGLEKFLNGLRLDKKDKYHIEDIIANISYKGSKFKNKLNTLEAKIVYDADKLDAIGAIGVARTLTTGAVRGTIMYDPRIPLNKRVTDLKKHDSHSSIHHFYDKILLLKDLMHTKTAKKLAKRRHEFIKIYLKTFFAEWEGRQ